MTLLECCIKDSEAACQERAKAHKRFLQAQRETEGEEFLLALGFTASDLAVEGLTVEFMRFHLRFLEDRCREMHFPPKDGQAAIHMILGLWGVSALPGYWRECKDIPPMERLDYCYDSYFDRKKYKIKTVGQGAAYCTGTIKIVKKETTK